MRYIRSYSVAWTFIGSLDLGKGSLAFGAQVARSSIKRQYSSSSNGLLITITTYGIFSRRILFKSSLLSTCAFDNSFFTETNIFSFVPTFSSLLYTSMIKSAKALIELTETSLSSSSMSSIISGNRFSKEMAAPTYFEMHKI